MAARRVTWLVVAPLILVGWLLSHCVAYQLVGPAGHAHHGLEEGGHGYLPTPGLVFAAALALALIGFGAAIAVTVRGSTWSRVPLAAAGAVPPLGFTVQEHLERLLATGGFPEAAALEPTFAIGLLLQLPLVAATLMLARSLLATAKRLGQRLRVLLLLGLPAALPDPKALSRQRALAPPLWPPASRHAPRAPPPVLVG
jgi:hypothetical protein